MSLLTWITGYDTANADRAAAADAELRRLNTERAARLGQDWLAQVERNCHASIGGGGTGIQPTFVMVTDGTAKTISIDAFRLQAYPSR